MCECNSQSYKFLFSDQFGNTVFWNLNLDTSKRNEPYGDKGNIHRWKLERRFLRNFLVMCEFISQSYTNVSWSSTWTLSLRKLRRASLDRFEAYADKGNIISWKRERIVVRNFFLICEFITQSYILDNRKQFANTLSWNLQSDIWEHLGAHGEKGNILDNN